MKKKIAFFAIVMLTGAAFVSAWEGAAAIAPGGDLPGGGYSIATNSFPVNTVIEVTNLENDKKVVVNVISGLGTTGLMATLSRSAAEAIGLRSDSSCRIRMFFVSNDRSLSHVNLGPVPDPLASDQTAETESPTAVYSPPPAVSAANNAINASTAAPAAISAAPADETPANNGTDAGVSTARSGMDADPASAYTAAKSAPEYNAPAYPSEVYEVSLYDSLHDVPYDASALPYDAPSVEVYAVPSPSVPGGSEPEIYAVPAPAVISTLPVTPAPVTPATSAIAEPVMERPVNVLSLQPSQERIPEAYGQSIPPEYLVPSLGAMEYAPSADFSPFQVPLITRLESGKHYVQVAAYARADNVEDEINRIGKSYPLAIQNIGTDSDPLFRVLLGPLSQNESPDMLQTFKNKGYKDAFVWRN